MSTGLELVHVRAGYGAVEALHDVSLDFPLGTTVAVLGRNGAGKSSLLRAASGTLAVRQGRVRWHGRDLTHAPAHERVLAGITSVPDDADVFLGLTVAENLALLGGGRSPEPVFAVFPELRGKADRSAATLSGGERRMLGLVPVLLRPGDAVLLDEASRGLSAGAVDRLYGVLADLATPRRVLVVVEQYQADVLRRADLVYVLHRGELAWAGDRGEATRGRLPAALA